MKTINQLSKTIILGCLMLSTFIALSNNTPVSEKKPATPANEKTIRDFIKFPQVLIPHNTGLQTTSQKVEVLFSTDKMGMVNFVLAKTNDSKLKNEIEKQFISRHFTNLTSDVVHSVVLNFKTI